MRSANSDNKIQIIKYKKESKRMPQLKHENFFMKQKDIYLLKLFSHKGLSNAVNLVAPKTHSKVLLPKLNFKFSKNSPKNKVQITKSSRNLFKSYSVQNKLSLSHKNLKPIQKFSIVLSPVHIKNTNIGLNSSSNSTTNNTTMQRYVNVNKQSCVINYYNKSESSKKMLLKGGINLNEQGSQTTFYKS